MRSPLLTLADVIAADVAQAPDGDETARQEGDARTLARARRILGARWPGAERDLADAWELAEPALVAFLAEPPPVVDVSPAEIGTNALRLLGKLEAEFDRADARTGRKTALAGGIVGALRELRQHYPPPPPPLPPNELHEALRVASVDCVAHLLRHTTEATAQFERDRAELSAWAARNLGPAQAAELGRRVDAMLGGPVA